MDDLVKAKTKMVNSKSAGIDQIKPSVIKYFTP